MHLQSPVKAPLAVDPETRRATLSHAIVGFRAYFLKHSFFDPDRTTLSPYNPLEQNNIHTQCDSVG